MNYRPIPPINPHRNIFMCKSSMVTIKHKRTYHIILNTSNQYLSNVICNVVNPVTNTYCVSIFINHNKFVEWIRDAFNSAVHSAPTKFPCKNDSDLNLCYSANKLLQFDRQHYFRPSMTIMVSCFDIVICLILLVLRHSAHKANQLKV